MRLRDYPGIAEWPPQPGGAYQSSEPFPTDESSVILAKVFPVLTEFVTFTGEWKGRRYTYDLQTHDESVAGELARWMQQNIGKKLSDFGDFTLDH